MKWEYGEVGDGVREWREKCTSLKRLVDEVKGEGVRWGRGYSSYTAVGEEDVEVLPLELDRRSSRRGGQRRERVCAQRHNGEQGLAGEGRRGTSHTNRIS